MPNFNGVVDISHHNGNVNLVNAAADGIAGVFQKATQGQQGPVAIYGRSLWP